MAGEIKIRGEWDRLRYTLVFEGLLVVILAPVLAIVVYTFFFTMAYDRILPVAQPEYGP